MYTLQKDVLQKENKRTGARRNSRKKRKRVVVVVVLVARVPHLASVALWVLGREVPIVSRVEAGVGEIITVLFHVVLLTVVIAVRLLLWHILLLYFSLCALLR